MTSAPDDAGPALRPGEIDTPFSRALGELIARHRDEDNGALIAALQMASAWLQAQIDGPEAESRN